MNVTGSRGDSESRRGIEEILFQRSVLALQAAVQAAGEPSTQGSPQGAGQALAWLEESIARARSATKWPPDVR